MKNYISLLNELLAAHDNSSNHRQDRTEVGTTALFSKSLSFNLQQGFPLVTTKKVHFHSVVVELLWFLRGKTNIDYLHEHNVSIWDEWADDMGDLGPIYGSQWRNWGDSNIDQIATLIEGLQKNPMSRRHVVSAWNVSELEKMKLPPCHILFQLFVKNQTLSLQFYQRSCDVFIGLPFNIASYALLLHIVAKCCNYKVGMLHWIGGDVHLYHNHIAQAEIQAQRQPHSLPSLNIINNKNNPWDYQPQDFCLVDYEYHPSIKAEIAI